MTLSIRFPKPDTAYPAEIAILAVRHQPWKPDSAGELARRLDINADVVDSGLWLIARDGRAVLEIYQASQSFRYSRMDLDGEGRDGSKDSLNPDLARRIGQEWIAPFLPKEGQAQVSSVTEQEVLVSERQGDQPRRGIVALDVNYRFTVEGLPLLGSGAKAKVSVHQSREVSGAYRFWRDVAVTGSARTVPLETVLERFSSSSLFSDLNDRIARGEVHSIRLGYLALPPTEPMSILIPALEIRGVISTEAQPRYEFIRYVAAIELDERQSKEKRLVNARPALLLA